MYPCHSNNKKSSTKTKEMVNTGGIPHLRKGYTNDSQSPVWQENVVVHINFTFTFLCFLSNQLSPPANYLGATWHVFPLITTRGRISVIKLLQFVIVCSFWASLSKALFWKACHQDAIREERLIIGLGQTNFRRRCRWSKLIEQTL